MKTKRGVSLLAMLLCAAVLTVALLGAGCGQEKPKVMVFLGKSSKSYNTMKPIIDNLEKKYKDKVTFVIVDYDNPKNQGEIKKYGITTDPTTIVFNTAGEIKEQFIGSAMEDMLSSRIESYIPGKQTSSGPTGSSSAPLTSYPAATPLPSGSTPGSVPVAPSQ